MRTNKFRWPVASSAVLALAASTMSVSPAAQSAITIPPSITALRIVAIDTAPLPLDVEQIALSTQYIVPGLIQPYGIVDQRNVRESRYTNPMHCDTSGALTTGQVQAAWQACSDRFFNVAHSP